MAFVVQLITEGGTCWYCYRVWNVSFSSECTLGAYKKSLAESDKHETHEKFLLWLIQRIIDFLAGGNSRDEVMHFNWPSALEIFRIELVETVWSSPAEEHLELKDYIPLHGDPETNNRGDTKCAGPGGIDMVKLSGGTKVWTKQRHVRQQAAKRQALCNSDDIISQGGVVDRFRQVQNKLAEGEGWGSQANAQDGNEQIAKLDSVTPLKKAKQAAPLDSVGGVSPLPAQAQASGQSQGSGCSASIGNRGGAKESPKP